MITCKELIEFLMAYVDGELGADSRGEFDRHLGACPSCVRYLETYKETVKLGKGAYAGEGGGGGGGGELIGPVPESLVNAVLATRKGHAG